MIDLHISTPFIVSLYTQSQSQPAIQHPLDNIIDACFLNELSSSCATFYAHFNIRYRCRVITATATLYL